MDRTYLGLFIGCERSGSNGETSGSGMDTNMDNHNGRVIVPSSGLVPAVSNVHGALKKSNYSMGRSGSTRHTRSFVVVQKVDGKTRHLGHKEDTRIVNSDR